MKDSTEYTINYLKRLYSVEIREENNIFRAFFNGVKIAEETCKNTFNSLILNYFS